MRIFRLFLMGVTLLTLAVIIGGGALAIGYARLESGDLPSIDSLVTQPVKAASRVFDRDGHEIAVFGREVRRPVSIDKVPPAVVEAVLATEDAHFYTHHGVDPGAIARAALFALKNPDRRPQGASTITQQLVKNLTDDNSLTLGRKVREALLALRFEKRFSKRQILQMYLNRVYFGAGAYGIGAAAHRYFGKDVQDLNIADAALLAGLLKAPSRYDPFRDPVAARYRRGQVIERMVAEGVISRADGKVLNARGLGLAPDSGADSSGANDWYIEQVRRQLVARLGSDELYEGGHDIHTALDPKLQEWAQEALRQGLEAQPRLLRPATYGRLGNGDEWQPRLVRLSDEKPLPTGVSYAVVLAAQPASQVGLPDGSVVTTTLHDDVPVGSIITVRRGGNDAWESVRLPAANGAIVVLNPKSGEVLAAVGGYSFDVSEFDRATQARRQTGSIMKSFVYLAALEKGFEPDTPLLDVPIALDQGADEDRWRPENYSGHNGGIVPLHLALSQSRNLATIRLLHQIGLKPFKDVLVRFGLVKQSDRVFIADGLGARSMTPLEMAQAYAPFVNGGHKVESSYLLGHGSVSKMPIVAPEMIAKIDPILEEVCRRGTAARRFADFPYPVGGKTGTTNDFRDAWFTAITPDMVVVSWVGFDQPRSMGKGMSGGHVAAPIVRKFLDLAHKRLSGAPLFAEIPKKQGEEIAPAVENR